MNEKSNDKFDVELPDGRIATCWEAQKQEYQNCKFSAGVVDGIAPDNLYLRIERQKEEPTFFFLRPDEVSAILFSLSGALWSLQIFKLENGVEYDQPYPPESDDCTPWCTDCENYDTECNGRPGPAACMDE